LSQLTNLSNTEIIIGHTADSHIDELTGPELNGANLRLADTQRCLNDILNGFRREKVDVIVHAGDLFDKAKLWSDRTLQNLSVSIDFLRSCAELAPTVIIMGTDNHDNPGNFEVLKKLGIPNLYVITEPQIVMVLTKKGFIQVAGLPVVGEENLLDCESDSTAHDLSKLSIEEKKMIAINGLVGVIKSLESQLNLTMPSILVCHYEIQGCERENGTISSRKKEIIVPLDALTSSQYSLICAGHIHKAQRLQSIKPIYYSGPPTGIGFGEEGQPKGFYIHRLGSGVVQSDFIKTSYRRFYTISLTPEDVSFWNKDGALLMADKLPLVQDSIVRVSYTCSDEDNKIFNKRAFEQYLYDQGAFFVHSITPENVVLSTVKQTISEGDGVTENIDAWLKDYFLTLDITTRPDPDTQEKIITNVLNLAHPIIALASAKSPSGKLSGVFSLKSLKAVNYRMHRNSFIDFEKIGFAIVNGKNGTGKSSFFSDALIDGFFEEPRSGETGSWITNGQWDGLIEIVFELNSTWKVTRQRSRRGQGKIELTLHELVGENWENRSGVNKGETQAKINALLGMDADTLRCVALVQQGRYDQFFKADRKDRMRILCAILGIGVYEVIMELAKDRAKEINREIGMIKDKVAELGQKLSGKDVVLAELGSTTLDLASYHQDLKQKEFAHQQTLELIVSLNTEIEKTKGIKEQIAALEQEVLTKNRQVTEQGEIIQKMNKLLDNRAVITEKAVEYETLKEQQTALNARKPQLESLEQQEKQLSEQLNQQENTVKTAEKILDNRAVILEKATECETLKEQRTALNAKKPQLDSLGQQENQLSNELHELIIASEKLGGDIITLEMTLTNQDIIKQNADLYRKNAPKLEAMNELSIKHRDKQTECREIETKLTVENNRLKHEYSTIETAISQAEQKALMLNNSGCIDSAKAACNFLADAVTANASLNGLHAKLEELKHSELRRELAAQLSQANEELVAIQFDTIEFERLKSEVIRLAPFVEQAAQIDSKMELLQNYRDQLQANLLKQELIQKQCAALTLEYSALSIELEPLVTIDARITELETYARLKEQIPAAELAVQTAQNQIQAIQSSLDSSRLQKDSLIIELEPLATIDARITELETYARLKEQIPAAELAVQTAQNQIQAIQLEVREKQNKAAFLTLDLPKNDKQVELDRTIEAKNFLDHELGTLRTNINNSSTKLGRLQSVVEGYQKQEAELSEAQEKLDTLTETWNNYNLLIKACGFDGVPLAIIRNIIPELTNRANYILGQMSRGTMAIEIIMDKEQANGKEVACLDVKVNEIYSGSLSFSERSGGEQVRAGLAFAFALSDIKARRIGIQVAFMAVDEPPFLDEDGTEAYCDALEWLYGEFPQMKVTAISHDPRMKARFKQEINCWKDDEGSHLKLVA
jgi:exonuclease SbcC